MEYEVAWIILCVFFWVLLAIGCVVGIVEAFVKVTYYVWDREDREFEKKQREEDSIVKKVGECVAEKIALGGEFEQGEN